MCACQRNEPVRCASRRPSVSSNNSAHPRVSQSGWKQLGSSRLNSFFMSLSSVHRYRWQSTDAVAPGARARAHMRRDQRSIKREREGQQDSGARGRVAPGARTRARMQRH